MVCWSFASKIYSLKGLRTLPLDKIKSVVPGKRTEGFQVQPITHTCTPWIASHHMLPDWANPPSPSPYAVPSHTYCARVWSMCVGLTPLSSVLCVFTRASMR